MAVKVEMILTDDLGNRIVVSEEYKEETSLLDKKISEIESLVLQSKLAIGKKAELELLLLNQKA